MVLFRIGFTNYNYLSTVFALILGEISLSAEFSRFYSELISLREIDENGFSSSIDISDIDHAFYASIAILAIAGVLSYVRDMDLRKQAPAKSEVLC